MFYQIFQPLADDCCIISTVLYLHSDPSLLLFIQLIFNPCLCTSVVSQCNHIIRYNDVFFHLLEHLKTAISAIVGYLWVKQPTASCVFLYPQGHAMLVVLIYTCPYKQEILYNVHSKLGCLLHF